MSTHQLPDTHGRTVRGALLVRGDVVVLAGAVASVRSGSTKRVVRDVVVYDHRLQRAVTRRVRRDAQVPVVRLVNDER